MRLLLILLSSCLCSFAATTYLTFAWDTNSETGLAGYILHSGTNSGVYTRSNQFSGTNTTGTVTNVPAGKSFWALTAYDATGLQSDYSNEVVFTNRLAAPKMLRISAAVQGASLLNGPWMDVANIEVLIPPTNNMRFFKPKIGLEEVR